VSFDPGSPAAKKAARGEDPATDAADWVARSTRAEVVCVLRVTERQAADLLRESLGCCAPTFPRP